MSATDDGAKPKLFILGLPRSGCESITQAVRLSTNLTVCSYAHAQETGFVASLHWIMSWIEIVNAKRIGDTEKVDRYLKRLLMRCPAAGGLPLFTFIEDLARAFPKSKFLVCSRRDPLIWRESLRATWMTYFGAPEVPRAIGAWAYRSLHPMGIVHDVYHKLTWAKALGNEEWNEAAVLENSKKWNSTIQTSVQNEDIRRVIVEDEWDALFQALGEADISMRVLEFPYLGSRAEFALNMDEIAWRGLTMGAVYLTFPLIIYMVLQRLRII